MCPVVFTHSVKNSWTLWRIHVVIESYVDAFEFWRKGVGAWVPVEVWKKLWLYFAATDCYHIWFLKLISIMVTSLKWRTLNMVLSCIRLTKNILMDIICNAVLHSTRPPFLMISGRFRLLTSGRYWPEICYTAVTTCSWALLQCASFLHASHAENFTSAVTRCM
jgi:hypothetical protein